jgi:hypothetical protein
MHMMMRIKLVCLAVLGATACGSSGSTSSTTMGPQTVAPSAASSALLAQISGYQSWPTFTENSTPKQSASHMNMFVVTYHNDVVTQAISGKTLPLPDGAIIVKQNLAKATDTQPMALTVMSKQSGSWYWLEATPDGKVILDTMGKPLEGTDVTMCITCHGMHVSNDDVITHNFSQ